MRGTLSEIARTLGKTAQSVHGHVKRFGIQPGDDDLYDGDQVAASMESGRAMDKSKPPPKSKFDLSLRKLEAEARILEIKARILEKSVLDSAAVENAWHRVAAAIRSEVMSIPAKLGQRGEMQPAAKLVQIANEICADTLRLIATQPKPPRE